MLAPVLEILAIDEEEEKRARPSTTTVLSCKNCHRVISCATNLRIHREKYCRYRDGKRAKANVHRQVVESIVLNDDEFLSSLSRYRVGE